MPIEKPVRLLGVRVDDISLSELLERIGHTVASGRKEIHANVNIHALNLACEHKWLRDFLNHSAVVFCDGYGVKLAAALNGAKIRERITYADMLWSLAEFAAERQISFYFLGGRPGVADKAAARLLERFPRLSIKGYRDGYFDKTVNSVANQKVVADINALSPDVLVLGFGMPLQERWLVENWGSVNARVALTGGAVFDYISGELARAPRWMADHGLEWLGRLIIEPRRLWRRYLVGNPLFFWRIFVHDMLGIQLPDSEK